MTTHDGYQIEFDNDDQYSQAGLDLYQRHVGQLLRRPEDLKGIALPTVRNIEEAELICFDFEAVITAGPTSDECEWGHQNHGIWTFQDMNNKYGPRLDQVEQMIQFGLNHEDLLVHCHAGISRSTATAWGIAVARGTDPEEAFLALRKAHPFDEYDQARRTFCPNRLLVTHLQDVLGNRDLLDIRQTHLAADPDTLYWL